MFYYEANDILSCHEYRLYCSWIHVTSIGILHVFYDSVGEKFDVVFSISLLGAS
jgi:hypothetical protein